DGDQHVRRRDRGNPDSARAPRDEGRSGARLLGLHHDADRRVRVRVVARAGHGVLAIPVAMPVYTSDALILRTYKLAEADRIVVFLTKDRGKKRGIAKGARRARSRFTGALEPLTRAGVAYYERELRDLVRINYVEPQSSPLAAI